MTSEEYEKQMASLGISRGKFEVGFKPSGEDEGDPPKQENVVSVPGISDNSTPVTPLSEVPQKRRGRPPGSKNKPKVASDTPAKVPEPESSVPVPCKDRKLVLPDVTELPPNPFDCLSEDQIVKVIEVVSQSQEQFTEDQIHTIILHLLTRGEIGRCLFNMILQDELFVTCDEMGPTYQHKGLPVDRAQLVPGTHLKYTHFGEQHLKKAVGERLIFVRWLEGKTAALLKHEDGSVKKYLDAYLDFLTIVKPAEQPWMEDDYCI